MCKNLRGVAGKTIRGPASLLMASPTGGAASAGVAARGPAATGLGAGVAAVGAASVAALGPAAAGLAARVAADGAAMATADAAGISAVPRGPIRWLGGRLLVLGGWGLQLPGIWYLNKRIKQYK